MAARTPGRILPAAHPHTEFTTTMVVPFWASAFSTSAAVRASAMPAEVSSWRIGAIIISGYILFPPYGLSTPDFIKKHLRFPDGRHCGNLGHNLEYPREHSFGASD